MDPATFENLHHEHQHWLSEIIFWQDEIKFLKKLCNNVQEPVDLSVDICLNRLAHHERMLNSMKNQITSHENFLKDMIIENDQDINGSTLDHQHTREHMKHFQESFKKLKREIFQINNPSLR